ncbi:iron chelate uptake ABC transporter family permease subunit [Marinobacterium mangrovicola]|uniref:Iron complex transport system permease protein n=1 Tax=Marinobacterium mangrovicola TaxID=1476959 RepID=A0A4R1GSR8_9GAMM|nr:iron chelate uptake ABC transporter family permease subunit [Marinobacterium mangrovicola]TCK09279.1 iron complex transport system permease protein [Marinobacterium mangrovicola]
MKKYPVFFVTAVCLVALMLLFIFWGAGMNFDYIIPKRLERLAAIVIGGVCVALASIVFQTLVDNRILTPSIMGYEAVYLMWQAILLLLLGVQGLSLFGIAGNFVSSAVLVLLYSWMIHRWLLGNGRNDVYRLLLVGLVLTMVLGTFTQFVQLRISPGEFSVFQGLSYTSFNRASSGTLLYACAAVVCVCFLGYRYLPELDVLTLGREQALSLGVNEPALVRLYLALIAILVAVSTSLIGPTAFLGIFIANMTYALTRSRRHSLTLPVGCALAIALFLLAQLFVEHLFNYKTTVSILVNLVCGAYFLMLMVRVRAVL